MIHLFLLLILTLSLFAHSGIHIEDRESKTLSYGLYGDIAYRDKDLYPRGIEGSVGHENHGEAKKLELNHIGLFLDGKYEDNFLYGVELNRHNDAEDSFNSYLEKLYVGYESESYKILLGRNYNNISFVKDEIWAYGFAIMPLAVDSFFDGTYIADGVFLDYSFMGFTTYLDITQDKYYQTPRATLKLEYKSHNYKLISYLQLRKESQLRVDYASTQHSHSHGSTNGCDELTIDERCYERKNSLFGLGFSLKEELFNLQAEYIYLDTEGYITSKQYRVKSENQIHSLYAQILSNYQDILFGFRSEWFIFSNNYSGGGALEVASKIVTKNADTTQYLQTLMLGYQFNKYNRVLLQSEYSQDNSALRVSYSVAFDSGF